MMSCGDGEVGGRRVTNVMPMPAKKDDGVRMAGSAPGARDATAICAAAKANRPIGTASGLKGNRGTRREARTRIEQDDGERRGDEQEQFGVAATHKRHSLSNSYRRLQPRLTVRRFLGI